MLAEMFARSRSITVKRVWRTAQFGRSPAACRRPLTLSISALFSSLVVPKHLCALEKRPVKGTVLNWSSWRNCLASKILHLCGAKDQHVHCLHCCWIFYFLFLAC
ncbi:uncharacterized protein LOC144006502 [Festucalex cinctus]